MIALEDKAEHVLHKSGLVIAIVTGLLGTAYYLSKRSSSSSPNATVPVTGTDGTVVQGSGSGSTGTTGSASDPLSPQGITAELALSFDNGTQNGYNMTGGGQNSSTSDTTTLGTSDSSSSNSSSGGLSFLNGLLGGMLGGSGSGTGSNSSLNQWNQNLNTSINTNVTKSNTFQNNALDTVDIKLAGISSSDLTDTENWLTGELGTAQQRNSYELSQTTNDQIAANSDAYAQSFNNQFSGYT